MCESEGEKRRTRKQKRRVRKDEMRTAGQQTIAETETGINGSLTIERVNGAPVTVKSKSLT